MKKLFLFSLLFFSSNLLAEQYLMTLEDKHYKGYVVEKPVENDNSNQPSGFVLNDLSHVNYNGNTTWGAGCQCNLILSGNLSDGWNYAEFRFSNWANVAAGGGLAINGSPASLYYGNNGTDFSNNQIISVLVKLPEGYVWYAKSGVWIQGNPRDFLNNVSDGNPRSRITVNEGDNVTFRTFSGTPSGTTTYTIYNSNYNYLNELDLIN